MIVGVIGSGAIGPDLAYGFLSALAREHASKVYLLDIKKEALAAGTARIQGYAAKAVSRGKLSPKVAKAVEAALVPTMEIKDLADCDYVLEAASEDLPIKRVILKNLEAVVRPDCLIGFATSGIPRAHIAAEATHPERCFVNHPFFPAWRSLPMEIVPSGDAALTQRMIDTMLKLGKVPIMTADVPCFAADDIFCNYISEAARIVEEGIATPAQVDAIVNDAIGGGGPFNVMDLTQGNHLTVHCQQLMQEAPTGSDWFPAPKILTTQGATPWHDRKNPGDPSYDNALKEKVLDRILAVLVARTYFVVDHDVCTPSDLNWLTRMSLGFRAGLLDLTEELGADRAYDLCTRFAKQFPGFEVPKSIQEKRLVQFHRNVVVTRDGDVAVVTIRRPEVKNALNEQTMNELRAVCETLGGDDAVKGVVITGFDGALAGADIGELAALPTPAECEAKCRRGQGVLALVAGLKKPVVAALNGPVLGGGAELSMACHARVVGPNLIWGQPEVNLGIIPGYGGTQRLPRLVDVSVAFDLLRTGRPVTAREAVAWGWATGQVADDYLAAATTLAHNAGNGKAKVAPVDPKPVTLPDPIPAVDLGHHSLATDAILLHVLKEGLTKPLGEGLAVEAEGFGRCRDTIDMHIGMTNFVQNGPRVPAVFLNE